MTKEEGSREGRDSVKTSPLMLVLLKNETHLSDVAGETLLSDIEDDMLEVLWLFHKSSMGQPEEETINSSNVNENMSIWTPPDPYVLATYDSQKVLDAH